MTLYNINNYSVTVIMIIYTSGVIYNEQIIHNYVFIHRDNIAEISYSLKFLWLSMLLSPFTIVKMKSLVKTKGTRSLFTPILPLKLPKK